MLSCRQDPESLDWMNLKCASSPELLRFGDINRATMRPSQARLHPASPSQRSSHLCPGRPSGARLGFTPFTPRCSSLPKAAGLISEGFGVNGLPHLSPKLSQASTVSVHTGGETRPPRLKSVPGGHFCHASASLRVNGLGNRTVQVSSNSRSGPHDVSQVRPSR